jgi:hypothetical protein
MKDSYERINEITSGYKFSSGELERTVLYVYCKTKDYVIFEFKETGQISYKTTPEFDDKTYKIALKLDKVESYLGENKTLWYEYKNTMADIYALYLSNDNEQIVIAEKMLDIVISEIDYNKFSKLYYLLPCLIAVVITCLLSIGFKSCNSIAVSGKWYIIDHEYKVLLYMMTFGGIGGLLSVAINIDKHEDKISRIKWQRVFAGVFRMLIAMLSGLIMYVLLQANIIGGLGKGISGNNYIQYALAILAGFSQNLIPNLANKGESILAKGETINKN